MTKVYFTIEADLDEVIDNIRPGRLQRHFNPDTGEMEHTVSFVFEEFEGHPVEDYPDDIEDKIHEALVARALEQPVAAA